MKNDGKPEDIMIVVQEEENGTIRKDKAQEDAKCGVCPPEPPEAPKTNKKRAIIRMVFLLAICALSIYIMLVLPEQLNEESSKTLGEIFRDMDARYFYLAIGVWGLMILLDVTKFFLIGKVAVGKAGVRTSFKVAMVGKYYDNITPFSAGEPFQIVYLNKKGYSGGQASAIVLIKFFVQMFAWLIVSAVLMIFFNSALDSINSGLATTLKISAWAGFVFTAIPPTTVLLFIFFPKMANGLIGFVAAAAYKLKIVKDKEKLRARAIKIADDFSCCISIMSKKPLYFVLLIMICFIEPIITLSLPYFLVVSFAHIPPSFATFMNVMALNIFANYAVVFLPTPGNTGFIETTFTLAFSTIASSVLFGVTFTWRFMTYYFYILVGLGIILYEIARDFFRRRKNKNQKES